MAAPSKVWVCWVCGFESRQGMDLSSECCELSGRRPYVWQSIVQRVPAECGREASILSRPWPTRDCCAMKEKSRLTVLSSVIVCSLRFHVKHSTFMKYSLASLCVAHSSLRSTVSQLPQQVGVSVTSVLRTSSSSLVP
jgi:hypothetical protein